MQFDKALHHLLKQKQYPVAQFARDVGISRTHLYRILHGSHSPTLQTMKQMSDALKMNLSDFIRLIE
ncbi:MAG: helix-turn-helix domain-containing protein [Sphaerochaetaceae bacterium]|jgi:DNA-binding phage protein